MYIYSKKALKGTDGWEPTKMKIADDDTDKVV